MKYRQYKTQSQELAVSELSAAYKVAFLNLAV